jgi:hypothetical protein
MKMKRLCRAQRETSSIVAECERKHGHKGKHRCAYVEGLGGRKTYITVRWK